MSVSVQQGSLEFRHLVDLDQIRESIRTAERAQVRAAEGQPAETALNDKQRRFAAEYLVDLNATQAAIRAGYSKATAGAQAHKLLQNADITRLVRRGQEQRIRAAQLTAASVLDELRKIAFADMRQIFTAAGELLPVAEWPAEVAATIASIEVEEIFAGRGARRVQVGTLKKIKQHDKLAALRMLAQHFKILTDLAARDIDATDADFTEMTDEQLREEALRFARVAQGPAQIEGRAE